MKGTVIQVGDGRGFVIATKEARYVVTAAHCLPNLPPADPAAYAKDRTHPDFLGPLGGPRDVWAECVFANPVADLAVLARPDDQELSGRAAAYDHLIQAAKRFAIGSLKFLAGSAACPAIRRPATHGCCRSTASGSRAGSSALAWCCGSSCSAAD